jgi:hypothetical protein
MRIGSSVVVAFASVTVLAGVNLSAASLGQEDGRPVLLLLALAASVAGIQSVARDPSALTWALLASVPALSGLLAEGSPTWLIGPLAALLLVAAELNALSWEIRGGQPVHALPANRLAYIGQIGALGLAASLVVGLSPSLPSPGGLPAVLFAAVALVILGIAMFGRRA